MENRRANRWNLFTREKSNEGFDFEQRLDMWNKMGPDEKARYGPVEEKGETLNIKCSLSKFTALVKKFKLDSSLELEDSPFKFLLKLKGYELDTGLIRKLVSEFDEKEMLLKVGDKNHKLSLKDFDDILKIGKRDLPKMKRHKLSPDIVNRFTSNNDVCMKKVQGILGKKEDVDDFKRAFALVCLRYVVCAPSRGKLGKTFLEYVENVEDLKSQPWAGLAMHHLQKGISTFRNSKENKQINLGGPMVFLELYHHKQVMGKEIEELIKSDKETVIKNMDDCYEVGKDIVAEFQNLRHENTISVGLEEHVEKHEENTTSVQIWLRASTDNDYKLLSFCFNMVADTRYVACVPDSNAFRLQMCILKELRPKIWLSSSLVNYVADMLSVRERLKEDIQRWFFPMGHRDFRIDRREGKSNILYINNQQLKTVKQIFFPLYKSSHFYLIVFNNEEHKVEVWDTLKRKDVGKYEDDIKFLCQFLDERTQGGSNDTEIRFKHYTPILVGVPQQHNDYDCGVFVCRSMEYPDEVMKFHN